MGAAPVTAGARAWPFDERRAVRWGVLAAVLSIPVYLAVGDLLAPTVGADVAWLAGGLIVLLAMGWRRRRGRPLTWLDRSGVYAAGALSLYLGRDSALHETWLIFSNVYFALLAITVVIAFRCSSDQRFAATPLDFLVVFLAVVFPQVPGLDIGYAQDLTRLVVLFYAIELVLTQLQVRHDLIRIGTCVLLSLPLLRLLL